MCPTFLDTASFSMTIKGSIRADLRWSEESVRYSICTIVTRLDQYEEMIESFRNCGFLEPDCEFLYLDNSQGNVFNAYTGNNLFLNVARGQFIILCHQDVFLMNDRRATLDVAIDDLNQSDPNWAVCGNAGGSRLSRAIRITDPHGVDQSLGKFPAKVRSLDENFLIVRRTANLTFSGDLNGFHLYGTDICLIADVLGYNCYVIDFHLRHKGAGVMDERFFAIRRQLIQKYQRAFRSRWIRTTCTGIYVSGIPVVGTLLSSTFPIQVGALRLLTWLKRLTCRSRRT